MPQRLQRAGGNGSGPPPITLPLAMTGNPATPGRTSLRTHADAGHREPRS